jgi:hypothetical protein
MGSAEVASILAPFAEYMIASEETEPGDGWDYARTMTNVSWKKYHDDWGLVEPDPSKVWIKDRTQIEDNKTYHVICIGGWGYVFIHEITKEEK